MIKKKLQKSLLCACCVSALLGVDYQNGNVPTNIILNANQDDTVTSVKSSQNWEMTIVGSSLNPPNMNISGTAGLKYTLTVLDDKATFFSRGFSVGSGVEVDIKNFQTLSIEPRGSITLAQGAIFNFTSSGAPIDSQGSEYGGSPKVRFDETASLILNSNSRATFSNIQFFNHDGTILIEKGAVLTINSQITRFQNNVTNEGGTIVINGVGQIIQGFYNIGGGRGVTGQPSISTFTHNGGTTTINLDFYNGGQAFADPRQPLLGVGDPGFGGGGNLIVNGGKILVTGKLISKLGGDLTAEGDVLNSQPSTIQLQGGTLEAQGGITNDTGSTLKISADASGQMGRLIGDLDTTNGKVEIDLTGSSTGEVQIFKLKNPIIGLRKSGSNANLSLIKSQFMDADLDLKTGKITSSINQDKVEEFEKEVEAQNKNDLAVIQALDEKFKPAFDIYSYDAPTLKSTAQNIRSGAFASYVTTPSINLDTMRANAGAEAARQSLDGTNSLSVNALALGIGGSSKGFLGGFNIGTFSNLEHYSLTLGLGYAYGASKAENSIHSTTNKSHNVSLSAHNRLRPFNSGLEFDLNAYYLASFMDISRDLNLKDLKQESSTSKSKSKLMQASVEGTLGYRFENERLSVKPFLGLLHNVSFFDKLSEEPSGALQMSAKAQNIYTLSAQAGLENRLFISEDSALILGLGYENLAFQSKKRKMQIEGRNLFFNMPYKHRLGLSIATDFHVGAAMRVEVGGFVKNAFGGDGLDNEGEVATNSHYYGLSASFLYQF